jgi:hypothetical protein
MSMMLSITVALEVRDAANRIAEALGWGPNNFTIATAQTSAPEVQSHVGLIVQASDTPVAVFSAAIGAGDAEALPPGALDAALESVDPDDLAAILPTIQITAIPADQATTHVQDYDAHCVENGLTRLVVETETVKNSILASQS